MSFTPIGDLAARFTLQQQNTRAQHQLAQRSTELVSGKRQDVRSALNGDYASLSGALRQQDLAQARDKTLSEALSHATVRQAALDGLRESSTRLIKDLELAASARQPGLIDQVSRSAKGALSGAIGLLNSTVAGQAVFAGTQLDSNAFIDEETALGLAQAATQGAATAADIEKAFDQWFEGGQTGFEGQIYQGAQTQNRSVRLSRTEVIDVPSSGNTDGLRKTLRGLLLAAVIEGRSDVPESGRRDLLKSAATTLRASVQGVISDQAHLGYAEEQMTKARVRASAERDMAERLQADLLGVDPYQAASRMKEAEMQLERLYTVTARTAQMSLLDFLR